LLKIEAQIEKNPSFSKRTTAQIFNLRTNICNKNNEKTAAAQLSNCIGSCLFNSFTAAPRQHKQKLYTAITIVILIINYEQIKNNLWIIILKKLRTANLNSKFSGSCKKSAVYFHDYSGNLTLFWDQESDSFFPEQRPRSRSYSRCLIRE